MSLASILIIDSGIGGLSIARDVRAQTPTAHITYMADLGHYPYGKKTEKQVSQRVARVVGHSIEAFKPNIVIIACNTASTLVLDELRSKFDTPFIGVVPAIKPAVQISKTGVIGVLATQGTISRDYTNNLLSEFAQNKEVHLLGSTALVNLAEKKLQGISVDENKLKQEVNQLIKKSPKMDTIVLACTHFPIIKEELKSQFPNIDHWIDSGEAIARRTSHLLEAIKTKKTKQPLKKKNLFISTSSPIEHQQKHIETYLGQVTLETISI